MEKISRGTPVLVSQWARAISHRDAKQMTDFYSDDAVLLATYTPILTNKQGIYTYFWDFLKKDNLKCKISYNITQLRGEVMIASGLYDFDYIDRKGKQRVSARYSFVISNGKIINHHSSVMPK